MLRLRLNLLAPVPASIAALAQFSESTADRCLRLCLGLILSSLMAPFLVSAAGRRLQMDSCAKAKEPAQSAVDR